MYAPRQRLAQRAIVRQGGGTQVPLPGLHTSTTAVPEHRYDLGHCVRSTSVSILTLYAENRRLTGSAMGYKTTVSSLRMLLLQNRGVLLHVVDHTTRSHQASDSLKAYLGIFFCVVKNVVSITAQ